MLTGLSCHVEYCIKIPALQNVLSLHSVAADEFRIPDLFSAAPVYNAHAIVCADKIFRRISAYKGSTACYLYLHVVSPFGQQKYSIVEKVLCQ